MVILITRKYMCEDCCSLFETEEEAAKCEESHMDWIVEPVKVLGKQYPDQLVLTLVRAHGTPREKKIATVIYERKEEIEKENLNL